MSPMAVILQRGRRGRKAHRPTHFLRSTWAASFWLLNLVVLFYAIENWRGARRFAEVKQRSEQHGVSLDWNSYAPPAIPDEENVAMHSLLRPLCEYEQIRTPHPKGGWTVTTRWLDSNDLKRLEAVRLPFGWQEGKKFKRIEPNRQHPLADLALWRTCFRHDTNFPSPLHPGAPAHDVLLALGRFEPELLEMHEALGRPGCRFRLSFDERPDMQLRHLDVFSGFARVLRLRAAAQSAVGEGEAALADIQDIFKLADCLKAEPLLYSFRTRAAVVLNAAYAIDDGLARQAWSDAQLLRLEDLLARQELLPGLELALNGETASALRDLDTIRTVGGIVDGGKFESLRWVPRGWFDQNNAWLANHMYQYVTPAFDSSTRRVFPATANAEAEGLKSRWLTPYSIFARFIYLPDTRAAVRRAAYAQTLNDQALLACALERHRLATGCFPDSLAALSPDYLSAMPRDVVSDAPLRYRLSPNGGFQLWSVGWNERDEAGLVCRTQNGGLDIEKGDWVWERPAPH
jgi:hypothetical protein